MDEYTRQCLESDVANEEDRHYIVKLSALPPLDGLKCDDRLKNAIIRRMAMAYQWGRRSTGGRAGHE